MNDHPQDALNDFEEALKLNPRSRHALQNKAVVLAEQKRVLSRVIPLHKELFGRKQVELTTTPFYHPILPLLIDFPTIEPYLLALR